LEKYWKTWTIRFGFSAWYTFNRWKVYYVWWQHWNIKKFSYKISDLVHSDDNKFYVKVWNLSPRNLYLTAILKEYPKDILKVKAFSNKLSVKRKIYKVVNLENLEKCNNYWYYWIDYDNKEKIWELCDSSIKEVNNNKFEKAKLYLIKDEVNTAYDWRNLVIEDYLAWTFQVLNPNFKTNSSIIKQNTSYWDYKEFHPNVAMFNFGYIWNWKRTASYFVRPEFSWTYILPPVSAYFMYRPEFRAHSEYNIIEVE
jgi:uncharacterized protein YfaS (alpha-2-macroglobulin family)